MIPLCQQPRTLDAISHPYRWFIFVTGVIEVSLWSGTIFGWASVVHVLKTHGIYSDLCHNETVSVSLTENKNVGESSKTTYEIIKNCQEQDEQFALVGTIAMVLYSVPGIPVGYALHYWGLGFTRILASILISSGFVFLSITTKENPEFVWGASVLLSIGGNTLRVTCLEFANLFPKYRYTAMSIISGTYTISAALFVLVQLAAEAGCTWVAICYTLAAASSMSLLLTIFMPRKHIPYGCSDILESMEDSNEHSEIYSSDDSLGLPLTISLLSISSGLHLLWLFDSLFTVHVFGIDFNSWINYISDTDEEVATYSRHYGYANFFCILVVPLPGIVVDALYAKLKKGKVGVDTRVARIQAMILPLIIVTVVNVVQLSCFYFSSSWAVYASLVCLIINRPSCWGVGSLFIRARFPVDHFNRIVGVYGSVMAVLTLTQCLHFKWLQAQFYVALGVLLGAIAVSIIHPLFLLRKSHLRRVITELHTINTRGCYQPL